MDAVEFDRADPNWDLAAVLQHYRHALAKRDSIRIAEPTPFGGDGLRIFDQRNVVGDRPHGRAIQDEPPAALLPAL